MENTQQKEIVNRLRVVCVINYPCTELFRDILRQHVTEIQMPGRLLEKWYAKYPQRKSWERPKGNTVPSEWILYR